MTRTADLILDWAGLDSQQIADRLEWLKDTLAPGVDWGYSPEILTCVLMNQQASVLYKMTWFSPGQQTEITMPTNLTHAVQSNQKDTPEDVW